MQNICLVIYKEYIKVIKFLALCLPRTKCTTNVSSPSFLFPHIFLSSLWDYKLEPGVGKFKFLVWVLGKLSIILPSLPCVNKQTNKHNFKKWGHNKLWRSRICYICLSWQCILALQLSSIVVIRQPHMPIEQINYDNFDWETEFLVLFNFN